MKQQNLLTKMLLLFALVVGSVTSVWGADNVIGLLDFTEKTFGSSDYTKTWAWGDWSLYGGANNNKGWPYVRFGGKASSSGTLASKTCTITSPQITDALDYVTIEHLGINGKKPEDFIVSSIVLEASSSSDFSTITSTTTVDDADLTSSTTTKTITITPTSRIPANSYIRIKINTSTTNTNNMGLDIQMVKFYEKGTDAALSSIAVTTAPTKTTYVAGDTFDPTGMVVTATYEDNSTSDVTSSCTFSPSGTLSTSDTEITITYTENDINKTTTQSITVNEYVQPTTVTIQMTNSLFGQEVHTSGQATDNLTFVGQQDKVTVTYYVPKGSNYYFNTSNTRPYNTCTLTYAAPNGYAITKIEFTSDGQNWKTATPSVGSMTDTKQWEGLAESVTFSWSETGTRIKTVEVTLIKATATVKIPASGYLTYCCTSALDFSSTVVEAYAAAYDETVGKVVLTKVEDGIVPANVGVVVYSSSEAGNYEVPVTTTEKTTLANNEMVGVTEQTAVAWNSGDKYNYILQQGKFKKATGASLVANRAYLSTTYNVSATTSGAPELDIVFGDGTTSIQNIERSINDNQYYTLDGRRVALPTKGLYIVNGKKVIIK